MFTFGGFGGSAVNNATGPPPLPLPRSQQPAAGPFNAVLGGGGGGGVLPHPGSFSGAFSSQPPHHPHLPQPQFSPRSGDAHAPHGAFAMSGAATPLHSAPIFGSAAPLSAAPVFGGSPPSAAPVLGQSGGGGGVLGGAGGPPSAEAGVLRAAAGPRVPPPPRSQRTAMGSGGGTPDRGGRGAGTQSDPRPVFGSPMSADGGGGGRAEAKPWLGSSVPSDGAAAAPSPAPPVASVAPAGASVFGTAEKRRSVAGPSVAAAGGSGILGSAFGVRPPAASGGATGPNTSTQPPFAPAAALPSPSSVSSVFGASPAAHQATAAAAAAAAAAPPPQPTPSVFAAATARPPPSAAPAFAKPEPTHRSPNSRQTTSGVFGGILGATAPPAPAAPVSSVFSTPSPTPNTNAASLPPLAATPSSTSTSSSNPFKPAFPPAAAAAAAAAPTANTSAFGLAAAPAKPPTSTTTTKTAAVPAPGTSVFASPARPPPTAAASSFSTPAPAASGPPTPSSAFATPFAGEAATTAGRRRGRSPPQQPQPQQQRHDVRAPPAQTARVEASAPPRPAQKPPQPQQQRRQKALQRQQPARPLRKINPLERLPIPSLPSDEKKICLAARVCKSFLLQLASASALGGGAAADHSRDEDIARALEQAYFGVVGTEGVHGDFGKTAGEMLALWQGQVRPILPADAAAAFPAEVWIALFGLGTHLNTITATVTSAAAGATSGRNAAAAPPAAAGTDLAAYKAGVRANPVAALTDACHYANELSELLQTLFQRGDDTNAPPYSIIPVVLRRVRSVFDEATARGVATVQSNLNAVTSKLFAVLNRRVKTSAVQPLNAPGEPARWLLTFDSKEKECLLHAFAYLIIEMIAADAPMNDDVELFIAAFHDCFPAALAERCMLYYRRACALLRQSLSMPVVEEAAALLAKALAVYPPAAPAHNKRVLQVKLLAAEVALGRLPDDDAEWRALGVPQLIDIVNALKAARLDLLDVALRVHGAFFVEAGVHNVLCLARQRLALLMVVKYYLTHGCESRLSVQGMVRYHNLPYSAADAGMVWLLPLLMEKHMNGVLDHDFLILSGKSPFDAYPHPDLLTAAAALATR